MATKQDLEKINEMVKFTKELVEEVTGKLPRHIFRWDRRLTVSAGTITWQRSGQVVIKMSSKIFLKAADDLGIDRACEEVHQTMLHEYGHLFIGRSGHNQKWREVVKSWGGTPTQYHSLSCGRSLIPTNLRIRYQVGYQVHFSHKSRKYSGVVVKHNIKNIRVNTPEGQWNIPWSVADEFITEVSDGSYQVSG